MGQEKSFDKVERCVGTDELVAEESGEYAEAVRSSILSRITFAQNSIEEELMDHARRMHDVGKYQERDRVVRLWVEFHRKLEALDLVSSLQLGHSVLKESIEFGYLLTEQQSPAPKAVPNIFVDKATMVAEASPEDGVSEYDIEHQTIDKVLLSKIIKLMAKAGTRKQGVKAAWSSGEILYGLEKIVPGLNGESLAVAIRYLIRQEVIIESSLGNTAEKVYSLVEKYETYLEHLGERITDETRSVDSLIRYLLASNKDAKGTPTPWSLNSLFFAARDSYPEISREDIKRAIEQIQECHETQSGVYQWISGSNGKPSKLPESKGIDSVEVCRFPDDATEESFIVATAAEAIYAVLKSEVVAGRGSRIWKDYDIAGLAGRGSEFGKSLKEEHLRPEIVKRALELLVEEKKLELVPVSQERPWLKQAGWKVVG